MTVNSFRKIALEMAGTIESAHMGHPDFRANGKIFATLHADGQFGMVKLTSEQQQQFLQSHPSAFTPENGAWGRAGCTRVKLAVVDADTLGEAMTLAKQNSSIRPTRKRR